MTTIKKRTMLQAQFHKAEEMVQESKDKLITNLKIRKERVCYIDGDRSTGIYLPTKGHPFDHYLCVAEVGNFK